MRDAGQQDTEGAIDHKGYTRNKEFPTNPVTGDEMVDATTYRAMLQKQTPYLQYSQAQELASARGKIASLFHSSYFQQFYHF
jgi:hypothetical protein